MEPDWPENVWMDYEYEPLISFPRKAGGPPILSALDGDLRLYQMKPFPHVAGHICGNPNLLFDNSLWPLGCFIIVEEKTACDLAYVMNNLIFPLTTMSNPGEPTYLGAVEFGIYTWDAITPSRSIPEVIHIDGYEYALTALKSPLATIYNAQWTKKGFSPAKW